MIRQFAIIGLSSFGLRMLEELSHIDCEILVIDKNPDVIESVKDKATNAFIADVINEDTIRKIIPPTIDAAIVDLGDRLEVSILVTNYLKKLGVNRIVAKAETAEHGEVLELVGATDVIFPNREAAKRVTPLLAFSHLFSFLPISQGLIIAEVKVPERFVGMTLVEADIRKNFEFNVIAIRTEDGANEEYRFFSLDYRLRAEDVLLVAGNEENLSALLGEGAGKERRGLSQLFQDLLRRGKERGSS